MKKTIKWLLPMMVTITAAAFSSCSFLTGNDASGSESSKGSSVEEVVMPEIPEKVQSITVAFEEASRVISWNKIENATQYRIFVSEYQVGSKEYNTSATSYTLSNLNKGTYKITVSAYDSEGKELAAGAKDITLTDGLNVLKTPVVVKGEDGAYTWAKDEGAKSYKVKVVSRLTKEVKEISLTEPKFDTTAHELAVAPYTFTVCAVDNDGVEGDESEAFDFYVKGNTNFNEAFDKIENGYVVADFSKTDFANFCVGYGTGTLAQVGSEMTYENAAWEADSVVYVLPEPILWSEIENIYVKGKTINKETQEVKDDCYFYLYNESNETIAIRPSNGWNGYGMIGSTKDEETGYFVGVASTDMIEKMRENSWHDNAWMGGEGQYLTKISFSCTAKTTLASIEYIGYTKRTQVEDFSVTLDGEALKTEYKDTEIIDFSNLQASDAEKNELPAEFRLYKGNSYVDFFDNQRLEAGEYILKVKLTGKLYGRKEIKFTVTADSVRIPESVTGLAYDETTGVLSWNEVEGVTGYQVRLTNINGDLVSEASVENTQTLISADEMGLFTVYVSAVNQEVVGDPMGCRLTSVGDSGFMQSVVGNTSLLDVANFDKAGYKNFLKANAPVKNVAVADGKLSYTINAAWSGGLEYYLPSPIKKSEIRFVEILFKGDNVNVAFVDGDGLACEALVYAGGYYGINDKQTLSNGYSVARFTFEDIKNCQAVIDNAKDQRYHWANEDGYIEKIVFSSTTSAEKEVFIDHIRILPTVESNFMEYDETLQANIIADFNSEAYDKMLVNGHDDTVTLRKVENGALTYKTQGDWTKQGFSMYFPSAIALNESWEITIRWKDTLNIQIYNEKNQGAYVYAQGNYYEGVLDSKTGATVTKDADGWYTATMTNEMFALSTNAMQWTNKKASALTKIKFVSPNNTIDYIVVKNK